MRNKSIQHWIVVAACCGLSASSIGICINSQGVFFKSVSGDLGVGIGTFALYVTICNLLTGIFSVIAMKLVKQFPFRIVVSGGVFLASGAMMLMSLSRNVWMFYLLGALCGIGCSFFALVVITYVLGNWFEQKHGFAVGLTLSFSGLSGAFFSPLLSYLITQTGWRSAYIFAGLFMLLLALPGAIFLLESDPAKKQLLPYGHRIDDAAPKPEQAATLGNIKFFSIPFIAIATVSLLMPSISGLSQHLPGYAQSWGGTASFGAALVSVAMLGNIVSKLMIGLLSDKIGPLNACSVMVYLVLLALFVLLLTNPITSPILLMIGACLLGCTYSVGAVGISLVTRHIFGPAQYSAVYPYISMLISFGSAISVTMVGFLFDIFRTYQYSVLGAIVFGCASLAILQSLRFSPQIVLFSPPAEIPVKKHIKSLS